MNRIFDEKLKKKKSGELKKEVKQLKRDVSSGSTLA